MSYAVAGVVAFMLSLFGSGGHSHQQQSQNHDSPSQKVAVVSNRANVPEPSTAVVSLGLCGMLLAYKLKKSAAQKQ